MSHVNQSAVHCINPECQRPYPQPGGNLFCNSCGAPLLLLDRYTPLQALGSGGFAQIYTVWDRKTKTEKVLKVLVEDSPKALELFAQEASVLTNLRHPGVPTVEPNGYFQRNLSNPKRQTLPCLVMEKINGETLEEIQKKYPQGCPQELVLNWLTQAVDILQHLHERNIIHRDLKPSNLMVRTPSPSGEGQLVMIDFGGAKQFSAANAMRSSSTRLFSCGYSPPEQVSGAHVGPAADFYALGRTMIELLTGRYPPDLEDPVTADLMWRHLVNVNPLLADLLDEMVQSNVRSRPPNATIIKKRLLQLLPKPSALDFLTRLQQLVRQLTQGGKTAQSPKKGVFSRLKQKIKQTLFKVNSTQSPTPPNLFLQLQKNTRQALVNLTRALGKTAVLIIKAIFQVFLACLMTIWTMILTGIGASVGTLVGFFLVQTESGILVAKFFSEQLPALFPELQTVSGGAILLFAAAGLGTAWGLVVAGGFGQRRRYLTAPLMGTIGYGLSWFVLQLITVREGVDQGLVGLILAAVSFLTLGLGLRSHHIVYAAIAAFGTAIVFTLLSSFGLSPTFTDFTSLPSLSELPDAIAFFSLTGVFLSFFLGVSYYLIVPSLRFLGWR